MTMSALALSSSSLWSGKRRASVSWRLAVRHRRPCITEDRCQRRRRSWTIRAAQYGRVSQASTSHPRCSDLNMVTQAATQAVSTVHTARGTRVFRHPAALACVCVRWWWRVRNQSPCVTLSFVLLTSVSEASRAWWGGTYFLPGGFSESRYSTCSSKYVSKSAMYRHWHLGMNMLKMRGKLCFTREAHKEYAAARNMKGRHCCCRCCCPCCVLAAGCLLLLWGTGGALGQTFSRRLLYGHPCLGTRGVYKACVGNNHEPRKCGMFERAEWREGRAACSPVVLLPSSKITHHSSLSFFCCAIKQFFTVR